MFIREVATINKKNGSTYIAHKLVEAYRTENNDVRQRIIMNLGILTLPRDDWKKLSSALESLLAGQETLFDNNCEINKIAAKAIEHHKLIRKKIEVKTSRESEKQLVSVDLNSLNTTEDRSLGAELVANNEWNRLKFDDILKKCNCDSKEISLMKTVIIGKLIEPSSDLAVLDWLQKLPEKYIGMKPKVRDINEYTKAMEGCAVMNKFDKIKSDAYSLNLAHTRDTIEESVKVAESKNQTYIEFIHTIFEEELKHRLSKA